MGATTSAMSDLSIVAAGSGKEFEYERAVELSKSSLLLSALKTDYRTIADLMEYNGVGTIKLLHACGALAFTERKSSFEIDMREGAKKTGREAWAKYLKTIKTWLSANVNDNKDLQPALDYVADDLHAYYFKKLPRWPAVGCKSEAITRNLGDRHKGTIELSDYIYVWAIVGTIAMQDERTAGTFVAHIWAMPNVLMRCMRLDRSKLKQVEGQMKDTPKELRFKLFESVDKCEKAPIGKIISAISIKL
jgi:hypothetical protein